MTPCRERSSESLALLRRQAMAPRWRLNERGQRQVEAKAVTKKRIGRSPDDTDALNLAFGEPTGADAEAWWEIERR